MGYNSGDGLSDDSGSLCCGGLNYGMKMLACAQRFKVKGFEKQAPK